jgi:hypothetical protein
MGRSQQTVDNLLNLFNSLPHKVTLFRKAVPMLEPGKRTLPRRDVMNNKKTRDRNANAVSHNMTGRRFVVLRTESEAEFQATVADYRNDFLPVGRAEGDLVFEMAVCKWRQQRAWRIETELINDNIEIIEPELKEEFERFDDQTRTANASRTELKENTTLTLMLRYGTRAERDYTRALNNLYRIQAERRRRESQPQPKPQPAPSPKAEPLQAEQPSKKIQNETQNDNESLIGVNRRPSAAEVPQPIRRESPKIGRNDQCPCGSGAKYKRCCLNKSSNATFAKAA